MPAQVPVGSEPIVFAPSSEAQSSSAIEPTAVKRLASNEVLFQVGDPRTCLYRVETGSLCIYEPRLNGGRTVIDFAFPGDLVGLGFLESHTCCARAVVETQLTCLPLEALQSVVEDNPKVQLKLDEAIEREFEFRRACLVKSDQQSPLERVAAFLVSLSRINAQEGRDPCVVAELCSCGFVADFLGLSVDSLAAILVKLEERGLIESCPPTGLRLRDISVLEEAAAQSIVPVCPSRREGRVYNREQGVDRREASDIHASAA